MKRKYIAFLLTGCITVLSGCAGSGDPAQTIELLEPAKAVANKCAAIITDIYDASYQEAYVTTDMYELSFERSGSVAQSYVQLGDYVEKGQIIASLNDSSDLNRINNYETQLEELNKEHAEELDKINTEIETLTAEWEVLIGSGDATAITVKELDIEAQLATLEYTKHIQALERETLETSLADAKANYYGYDLYAPCSGTIVSTKGLTAGSRVAGLNTVAILVSDSAPYIKSDYIPEADLENYHQILALIGDKSYELKNVPLDPDLKTQLTYKDEDLYNCYVPVDEEAVITQGTYVALVLISNYREDVLAIPSSAIKEGTEGYYVYVIDENDSHEYRVVEIGTVTESYTEIISGLQEGEYVYVQ